MSARGDVLVVWKLDRVGRSLAHLIATIQDLQDQRVGFRSLQEQMDTTTPSGQLIFHILGALAEFECALIRERTQAGLAAARARGRMGGWPRSLSPDQVMMARDLLSRPDMTGQRVADALHVSRATLYRALWRPSEPCDPQGRPVTTPRPCGIEETPRKA